jgi:hypothetical protein
MLQWLLWRYVSFFICFSVSLILIFIVSMYCKIFFWLCWGWTQTSCTLSTCSSTELHPWLLPGWFFFSFSYRVSLCSLGWLWTFMILLPQSPKCWKCRCEPSGLSGWFFKGLWVCLFFPFKLSGPPLSLETHDQSWVSMASAEAPLCPGLFSLISSHRVWGSGPAACLHGCVNPDLHPPVCPCLK